MNEPLTKRIKKTSVQAKQIFEEARDCLVYDDFGYHQCSPTDAHNALIDSQYAKLLTDGRGNFLVNICCGYFYTFSTREKKESR